MPGRGEPIYGMDLAKAPAWGAGHCMGSAKHPCRIRASVEYWRGMEVFSKPVAENASRPGCDPGVMQASSSKLLETNIWAATQTQMQTKLN